MHTSVENLKIIQNKVNEIVSEKQLETNPQIIAVTKTFSFDKISPLMQIGHLHFGENKIQEAESKWTSVKKDYDKIQLHMLGKLQSNKAKKAEKLFDFIHSLDNAKLASKISQYEKELNKKTNLFIQVNLAKENQKSGILLSELDNFYDFCVKKLSLNIIGLMCLPPIDSDANKYFRILKANSDRLKLKELSIGMSGDYEHALLHGATYLRLGTAIFGQRKI